MQFYLNILLGEIFGAMLLSILLTWVSAYAAQKGDKKFMYSAIGGGVSIILGALFALLIQSQATSAAFKPAAGNAFLLVASWFTQGFTTAGNWGFFPIVLAGSVAGTFLGVLMGQYMIRLAFRREELIKAFSKLDYDYKHRYAMMEILGAGLFFMFVASMIAIKLTDGVLAVMMVGVISMLIYLVFAQKYDFSFNPVFSAFTLMMFRMMYGSEAVRHLRPRMLFHLITGLIAAAIVGATVGLIVHFGPQNA